MQDLVHCTSHARVKLSKHVVLTMSVKHITRSKKWVTIFNRIGYCSSYKEIEQVEMSLANESVTKSKTVVL